MNLRKVSYIIICVFCLWACHHLVDSHSSSAGTFTNPILPDGYYPRAILYEGKYYYTHATDNKIMLWETDDLTDLQHATCKEVWRPTDSKSAFNIWAPELHRIQDKWYIYFAADDGNMDNHQINVIENVAASPLEGVFVQRGPIVTCKECNWGIHASTFSQDGQQYLVWSGWPQRRIVEETQCIYIAKMKNPWTLDGERVMLSKPDHVWERQWISPDGNRSAYPIYVNESPQPFRSKDGKKILIYYAASGNWTPYYCTGMLMADASADLLNPSSWTKSDEPVFSQSPQDSIWGPGGCSFVYSPDSTELYMLYHAWYTDNFILGQNKRNPRLQKVDWDDNGIPILGKPVKMGVPMKKPSNKE